MTNPYYNHGSFPAPNSAGASASMRSELDAITAGFNKLPGTLTANGVIFVNSSGTALEARAGIDGIAIGGTTPAAGTFTSLTLTTGFVLPLGAVGTPSLSLTGDSNTGLYSPGADQVALTAGGAQQLLLSTTAATFANQVVGPAGAVGAPSFAFAGDLNNGWWAPTADTQAWSTAGSERMRVDASGNLLLGTTSSNGTRLKLDSGGNPWFTFGASSAVASYGQFFRGGTVTIGGYIGFDGGALIGTGTGTGFTIRSEADLILMSGAAERVRIDSTGNMGIGTASPQRALHVNGSAGAMRLQGTSVGGYLEIVGPTNSNYIGTPAAISSGSTVDLGFYVSSAERLRIDSSGRVGLGVTPQAWGASRRVIEIGTSTDQSYVLGYNSVNIISNVYFDGANFRTIQNAVGGLYQLSANTHSWFTASNGGAGGISTLTQVLTLDASGQLGIGVNPGSMLDISKAGTTIVGRFRAAAGFAAGLQMAGNNTTAGTTSFDLQQDSAGNADIVQRNNARLSLYANASEWVRINPAGDVSLQLGAGALRLNSHISRFESAEQAVPTTTFASNTLTHGGSRVPDVCRLVLRCKTAELGYTAGDEVDVTLHNHTMTDRAFNVWHSTTQTGYVWITGLNVAPSISHKTTGTMTTVTAANWRVVVYNHWL